MPQYHAISWHYYFTSQNLDIVQTSHCCKGHKECEISTNWDHPLTSVFLGRALVIEEELGKKISWPWHSFQLGPLAMLLLRVWFPSLPHAVVLCNDSTTTVTTQQRQFGQDGLWRGLAMRKRKSEQRSVMREKKSKPDTKPKKLKI